MADKRRSMRVLPRLKGQGELAPPWPLGIWRVCVEGRGRGALIPLSPPAQLPLLILQICTTISKAAAFPFNKRVSRQRFTSFSHKTNP